MNPMNHNLKVDITYVMYKFKKGNNAAETAKNIHGFYEIVSKNKINC